MNKRTIAVLATLLFAFSGVTAKLYQLNSSSYLSVAENQSTLKVVVATSRGTLYDCHLQPLTATDIYTMILIDQSAYLMCKFTPTHIQYTTFTSVLSIKFLLY